MGERKKMRISYLLVLLTFSIFFSSSVLAKAVTLDEAIDIVLSNNLQILTEKEKVREADQMMQEASAGYFPTLDLDGSYTHLSEAPSSLAIPGVGEFAMGEQDTTAFTLSLTQPLYTSGRLGLACQQARFNYQKAKESLQHTQNEVVFQVREGFYSAVLAEEKDNIKLQVKEAFWDIQGAKESLSAQEKNIEQAKEALSIAEARYKRGTITQLELLDAQVVLTQARLGYTEALYDYNSAKAALIKAVGENIE
jgi:outer membrane protein